MPASTAQRRRRTTAAAVAVAGVAVVAVAGTLAVDALRGPVVVRESCTATVDGASFELEPDQAGNAATITAVAVRRGLPARAATIAIATAVQESKLRNLDYGDRDSVGLFQQRPSQGWGSVEQIMDPIYSTNAFYDALVKVDGFESMEITVASDRVQRSAFPDAVADHEPEGRAYASALTGYSPAALTCRLRPVSDVEPEQPGGDGLLPRSAAVRDLLLRDYGQLQVRAATAERLAVDTGDGDADQRLAWSVAHWAVANADALDVVRVRLDDRTWQREDPDGGWAQVPDDGAAPAEQRGTVVIEVASG